MIQLVQLTNFNMILGVSENGRFTNQLWSLQRHGGVATVDPFSMDLLKNIPLNLMFFLLTSIHVILAKAIDIY